MLPPETKLMSRIHAATGCYAQSVLCIFWSGIKDCKLITEMRDIEGSRLPNPPKQKKKKEKNRNNWNVKLLKRILKIVIKMLKYIVLNSWLMAYGRGEGYRVNWGAEEWIGTEGGESGDSSGSGGVVGGTKFSLRRWPLVVWTMSIWVTQIELSEVYLGVGVQGRETGPGRIRNKCNQGVLYVIRVYCMKFQRINKNIMLLGTKRERSKAYKNKYSIISYVES